MQKRMGRPPIPWDQKAIVVNTSAAPAILHEFDKLGVSRKEALEVGMLMMIEKAKSAGEVNDGTKEG